MLGPEDGHVGEGGGQDVVVGLEGGREGGSEGGRELKKEGPGGKKDEGGKDDNKEAKARS